MPRKPNRDEYDAVEILRRLYVDGDPEAEAMLEEPRAEAEVSRAIHRLRTLAGLTHHGLAKRVGTKAAVIRRMEDGDFA